MYKDGAIIIKNIKGRKTRIIKKKKRTVGNIRKKINKRKKDYVTLTRKLRKHLSEMNEKLTEKEKKDIRKKIRNRFFRSKAHLKEHIGRKKNESIKTKTKRREEQIMQKDSNCLKENIQELYSEKQTDT